MFALSGVDPKTVKKEDAALHANAAAMAKAACGIGSGEDGARRRGRLPRRHARPARDHDGEDERGEGLHPLHVVAGLSLARSFERLKSSDARPNRFRQRFALVGADDGPVILAVAREPLRHLDRDPLPA